MKYTKQFLFILILCFISSVQAALPPELDTPLDDLTIYSSAAITMGASSVVGGNIQVEAAATIGASSTVSGYIITGAAVTLDATVKVGGYIEARDAGTIGADSTVGGHFTTGDAATLGATTVVDNIMVGGDLTAGAAILVGAKSVIAGNLKSGSASPANLDANAIVGGNATAGTALTLGATVTVGGNAQAGTGAVALGEYSIVAGDATAGTTVTVPATASVGGNITEGKVVNFPVSTKEDIDDQSPKLQALQAELAAMEAPAANQLATSMTVSTTLKKGVYHTTALTTTAGITITLDGENEDGHWLINSDSFIAFGASTIIELKDVTANSTITWNAGGYISAGASVNLIGTFFAGSYILTGASTTLQGVDDGCGGFFTTTGAVTLGASNLIGPLDCKVQPPTPVSDHHFDEESWSGVAGEVIDSSGNNYHGVASQPMTNSTDGVVCNAADFSETGTSDYVSLNGLALDNLDDFSISIWGKLDSSRSGQQTIFSAASNSDKNGVLMFFSNTKTLRFYFRDTIVATYSFTDAISDDEWHHYVWTRKGDQHCLFMDGVSQGCQSASPFYEGSISVASNGLIIGQEQDSVGGGFSASQDWEGLVDEPMIFNAKLSPAKISSIYTNQTAGKNYDGTSRACSTLIAEYRFEEASWNGVAGEILDNSGNGYNAARINNNSTPEIASPALTGNPGTCGYANQDNGSIQVTGLPLDTTTDGVKTTVTFWMNWNGKNNVMPIGWDIHDIWMVSSSIGFNTGNSDVYGISSQGFKNVWRHVAVEFTNGSVTSNRMHIDGVEQVLTQRRSSPNNSRAFVDSELRIGGWSRDRNYDFRGLMDEVRVYQGELSTAQINTIMNEVHPCNTTVVHHYEIVHDGQGLTCEAETLIIKACTDESCSSLSTEPVTLDVLADGTTISSPTFTGTTTVSSPLSSTVNFNHTVVETLTFSVANATIAASNDFLCNDGSSDSCDMAFSDAGFRFLYGTAETTSIGNQTSGDNFAEMLQLQAVKNDNGVCTGLFTDNVDVELSQQNIAPSGTTGLNFKVNGTSGTSIGKYPTYTPNITLNFGAESKATIPTPVYLDAGKIRLQAKYNVGGVNLVGNSNDFWVSPKKLVVTTTAGGSAINGNSDSSAITHKAGQPFDFIVTAYNSLGTLPTNITVNYVPNDIQLLLTRTGPTPGGVDGTFNYGTGTILSNLTPSYQSVALTTFNSGVSSTTSASYSEVGLLNLDLQDIDYGFSDNIIAANAVNIGRFTPAYFEQTVVEQGSLDAVCNQNSTFAYTGQVLINDATKGAISYLVNPIVELTGKNVQEGTTKNYTEAGYNKLIAAANFIIVPTTDSTISGKDSSSLPLIANLFAGTVSHTGLVASDLSSFGLTLDAGVLHYELANDDNFYYPRNENSEVFAQNNDIDFFIDTGNFVDSDDISITSPENITGTAGINIRFGRASIENSFGPETSNLPQYFSTQYLNDSGSYVLNEHDSCTKYDTDNTNNFILTSGTLNESFTGVNAITGTLEEGETRAMILTAPGAGNQGTINVEYDIYSWLKYDWDWNGVDAKLFDENPSAVATFGLFRGNDRIIYMREIF